MKRKDSPRENRKEVVTSHMITEKTEDFQTNH